MSITASYSLTLDEWLEANRLHRNPIQLRSRRSSLVLMAWLMVPILPFVANFILAFTPYAVPPQVLNRVAPYILAGFLIGAVLFLSGPSQRKSTPWLATALIAGGVGVGISQAFTEVLVPEPATNEPFSVLKAIWPLVPWIIILVGMVISTRRFLERVALREWESSGALRNPTTVTVAEGGVTFEQADQTHQFQWTAFVKVRESKELFVLYASENRLHILPKRAFAPKDLAALAAWLKSKVVPADPISTAFSPIVKPRNPPVQVQPLESREFM